VLPIQPGLPVGATLGKTAMGLPAHQTQSLLQTDVFKELVNKFAWVLGTTYHAPYGNLRTVARSQALILAGDIIRRHGYPKHLAK